MTLNGRCTPTDWLQFPLSDAGAALIWIANAYQETNSMFQWLPACCQSRVHEARPKKYSDSPVERCAELDEDNNLTLSTHSNGGVTSA